MKDILERIYGTKIPNLDYIIEKPKKNTGWVKSELQEKLESQGFIFLTNVSKDSSNLFDLETFVLRYTSMHEIKEYYESKNIFSEVYVTSEVYDCDARPFYDHVAIYVKKKITE